MTDLDVASDGSDSFDRLTKICKALENERNYDLMKELREGSEYLKSNYCAHCSISDCRGIADQCIKYALPDEKSLLINKLLEKKHYKACFECDSLSQMADGVPALMALNVSYFR